MRRRAAKEIETGAEADADELRVHDAKDAAAGVTGVAVALKRSVERMGPARSARTLLRLNQAEGFDCMSCAWPDPEVGHRHTAEFCENGAKAVAEEATTAPGRRRSSSPRTASPSSTPSPSTGSASRAGSPTRWSSGPAARTTSRSTGTRRSRWSPGS